MLIAVNNCFTGNDPGENNFARQLFKRLVCNCPQHKFLLFTNVGEREAAVSESNLQIVKIPALTRKLPLSKIIWQRRLLRIIQQHQPELLINLNPFLALSLPKPQLMLADEMAVENFHRGASRSAKRKFLLNLSLARKIAVPSTHEEMRLQPFIEPLQKIKLVYAGAEWPSIQLDWNEKEGVKEKYTGGKEYFLVQQSKLSTHLLINLLKAFSLFKKRQQSQLQLLIPAIAIEKQSQFEEKLAAYKYRDDVQIVSGLPATETNRLVATAYAIIDPAQHLQTRAYVLQAFESQTPLIIGKASPALVWTGPDTALVADMESPDSIAAKMMILYKDEHLRKRLVEAANARLEVFNWEKAAEHLQLCLEAVIQKS